MTSTFRALGAHAPRTAGVLAMLALSTFLSACGGGSGAAAANKTTSQRLSVQIGDNRSTAAADCAADAYDGRHFSGTRLTLKDAAGAIVDTGTAAGDGRFSATTDSDGYASHGCLWSVILNDLPVSKAYTLQVAAPDRAPETLTYSDNELKQAHYALLLTVNR